jgi:hypothetical protein
MNQRLDRGARYAWTITIAFGPARMDSKGITVGNGETVAEAKEAVRVFSAGRMNAPVNHVTVVAFTIASAR